MPCLAPIGGDPDDVDEDPIDLKVEWAVLRDLARNLRAAASDHRTQWMVPSYCQDIRDIQRRIAIAQGRVA